MRGIFTKPMDPNLFFNHTPRDSIDMISSIRSQSKVVGKDIEAMRTAGRQVSMNKQRSSSNKYLLWNQHEGILGEEDLRDK